ncbi:hypothetical protein Slin15195_G081620 [Septoria linicola]|uniref:Uncharacterized protein n=1 Tax=Septoria linicola TaxID=215465 RepID=A0A9Q9EMV0_9PEZI|nr:hypothetical protein Slin15195_G081620 [Septoria linicola]
MAALDVLQAAQLEFISPAAGFVGVQDGAQVDVVWSTPWELTNLEVWQGSGQDGSYIVDVLGANLTQQTTTYSWNAPSTADSRGPIHFRLQKGDLPNDCETCIASSSTFSIEGAATQPRASSTPTSSPEAAESTAAAASTSAPGGISHGAKLGIGLGVGLGAPIFFALIALMLLCLRRRQRRQHQIEQLNNVHRRQKEMQAQEVVAADTRYSTGAESWLTKSSEKTKSYHGPFEFEEEPGRVKPGWERLFGRNGIPHFTIPERSKSGRAVFKS